MAEPCKQEDKITAINSTLARLEDGNGRVLLVLERIAEQGAFIKSLQEQANRQEKDTENLFKRMRDIEITVEGDKVKIGGIVAGVSLFVSAITAFIVKLWK